jgi:hypothetical protein
MDKAPEKKSSVGKILEPPESRLQATIDIRAISANVFIPIGSPAIPK